MVRSIWLRRVGPGAIALVAVGLLASTTLGARDGTSVPRECGDADRLASLPARADRRAPEPSAGARPWFRLDPALDPSGALAGQRLTTGRADGTGTQAMDLPPESFASGPFGRVVLVGTDDGSGSRLVAVDVVAGCTTAVYRSADIVRRATIAPDGRSVLVFRLERRTRADDGIWRVPLAGDGPATRILPALDPDPRFGITWSTDLVWSTDDSELAIQSCGEIACRTRVFTPGTGALRLVDDPDLGPAIGLAGDHLVAYLACLGMPCPIVAVAIADGTRRILADDAGPAVLIATDDGPRLVLRHVAHGRRVLSSVSLDDAVDRDLGAVPAGFEILAGSGWSGSGTALPPGWIALTPGGRFPAGSGEPAPILRHVPDGRSSAFDEVLP